MTGSSSDNENTDEEDQIENSVMRPYEKHFGSSCEKPVTNSLSDVLLAINFNHPHYSNIPILLSLYKHVFPHYVFCGPERDPSNRYNIIVVAHPDMQRGFYGYQCLAYAIKEQPGFAGYLYINDDMIINWWTFLDLDKTKIWVSHKVKMEESTQIGYAAKTKWWKRANAAERCTEAFQFIETEEKNSQLLKQYFKNTHNERICVNSWSDIFYVPAEHSKDFAMLSTIFYDHLVFLEAAVQTVLFFLDDSDNTVLLNGLYLPEKFGYSVDYSLPGIAWQVYDRDISFIHPYKLDADNTTENRDLFKEILVDISDEVVKSSCLDIVVKNKINKKKNKFSWSTALGVEDWSKEGG